MQNSLYGISVEFCNEIEQPRLTKSFLSTRHKHLTLKLRDLDNGIQVSISQGQTSLGESSIQKVSKTILKNLRKHLNKEMKMQAKKRFFEDSHKLSKRIIKNKICRLKLKSL